MKAYTIATEAKECYGHGSYGTEQKICRIGCYGEGEFPPVFTSKEEAQKFKESMESKHDKVIVEVELVGLK